MTTDAPTYYFAQPDSAFPVGGNNVALAIINTLNKAGYQAAPLYGSARHTYRFAPCDMPAFYDPRLIPAARRHLGRRQRLLDFVTPHFERKLDAVNTVLELKPHDVIVMPEYWYPNLCDLFPVSRRILLAQDVFGLMEAVRGDRARNASLVLNSFDAVITTSAASGAAYEYLSGGSSFSVPVVVSKPNLTSSVRKKKQIAYFRRKRLREADLLSNLLSHREIFADWSFVAIENMSEEEVAQTLSESLVFLSFSSCEGFGLPPAEAMAAGCLVIGYTGVGGEEYFTDDIAFPIADSDLIAFAKTVEAIAGEYERDPARLDQMRHAASKRIVERYSFEAMSKAVLDVWSQLHARFC